MADVVKVMLADEDYKGAEWTLNGSPTNKEEFDSGFTMINPKGKKTPTWEDLQPKLAAYQVAYDALGYQRLREPEYPTIAELVVALYDTDDKADIDKRRADVKAKYPKP
jgi:hypothetical protein